MSRERAGARSRKAKVSAKVRLAGLLDRGRDTGLLGTPRTDPDGRLLTHPVLISDDWRQSDQRDRDGARAVAEASGVPA
jgi:hypothetical protein